VTIHLDLAPRLRIRGGIPALPHSSSWHRIRFHGMVLSYAQGLWGVETSGSGRFTTGIR